MQQAYIVLHNFVYRPGGRLYQTGDMLKGVYADNDPWIKGMIRYGYIRPAKSEDYSTVDNLGHNIARQVRNRRNRAYKASREVNAEFNLKHNNTRSNNTRSKKRSGSVIRNSNSHTDTANGRGVSSRSGRFNGGLWSLGGIDLTAGQGKE